MRRLILFRYHSHVAICRTRMRLLRKLNPAVPIYGLYGGPAAKAPAIGADEHYRLPMSDPLYKWLHGDLCVSHWFARQGHAVRFDMLHVIEWDLVLLRPITALFGHIRNGIALTAPRTVEELVAAKWYWLNKRRRRDQLKHLRRHLETHFRVRLTDQTQVAGLFPGATLSREFLERYAAIEPPEITHDEIRLAAFAQVFGMSVHDTRLGGRTGETPYFNCDRNTISAAALTAAWREHRQSAFHPVHEDLSPDEILTDIRSPSSLHHTSVDSPR